MYRKTAIIALIMVLMTALCFGTAVAASEKKAEGSTDWKYHDIVDVEFVKQYAKVPMAEDVMIIDARPKRPKYDKGHIPMAVSMPYSQFDKMVDILPENKDALLIFYCGGVKCKLSYKAAWKAEKLGYTNVKVFAEGFPRWMKEPGHYASVSEDWVQKQIEKQADTVVVDSRPKRKKYDKGHITGAISIPASQFDKMVGELPQDKGKLTVFYCGGYKCKLSHKSAQKAMALGYTKVKVLSAGYPAWKKKYWAAAAAPAPLKAGEEEGSLDIATFKKMVAENPESLYLVDVRDADEFAAGSLKTAINIPVDELENKISTLPTDKPVVFICGTGARSGETFYMVQDIRPELKTVYYIEAEMTFGKDGSFAIAKTQE